MASAPVRLPGTSCLSLSCPPGRLGYIYGPVTRPLILIGIVAGMAASFPARADAQQAPFAAAGSGDLNYEQFGALAIQDGGRRKPIDTFAKESLIRLSGRSVYKD